MSLMDKIRSIFSGGASDSQAGEDRSRVEEPVSPTAPTVPTGPAGMPTSEPADEDEPR